MWERVVGCVNAVSLDSEEWRGDVGKEEKYLRELKKPPLCRNSHIISLTFVLIFSRYTEYKEYGS